MQILKPNPTCDINSITWLNFINKVIVSKQHKRMRGLPGWHIFRRLLQFDLAKNTEVVVSKKQSFSIGHTTKSCVSSLQHHFESGTLLKNKIPPPKQQNWLLIKRDDENENSAGCYRYG